MNMNNRILLSSIVLSCFLFPTGTMANAGSDAAMLKQLAMQLSELRKQTEGIKKTIDLTKRLEELESVKHIKSISESGQYFKSALDETDKLIKTVQNHRDDPFSLNSTDREIDRLLHRIDQAKNSKDKARAYANVISSLQRLKFLGKVKDKSMKTLSTGANEQDRDMIIANNTTIMADLLIQNEKEKQIEKSKRTEQIEVMRQSAYEQMYQKD